MIDIHDSFEGDGDVFTRIGKQEEKLLLDGDQWWELEQWKTNKHLIVTGQASHTFKLKSIDRMKELSEHEAFLKLTVDIV